MTKSDLIITNIAISVNKSAFQSKKCHFSPLLSALLKTAPSALRTFRRRWRHYTLDRPT